jgi:uracil-DNA glycosylase
MASSFISFTLTGIVIILNKNKQKMDLEEIKQKMFEKLKPSGWDRVLKSFIFSSEFDDILTKLYTLSKEDKRFTPPLKQVFRAFEECPYDKLQLVIIGQDPYPQLGVADGISFSCSNTDKAQPSLRYILDEVNRSVYGGHPGSLDVDLKRWSNQGVLMLNTALTVEVGKVGSHYDIWKKFTAYLLDWLNTHDTGLVYLYMGKKAEEWSELTDDNTSTKYFVKHPASAAYSGGRWDSEAVFMKIQLQKIITW